MQWVHRLIIAGRVSYTSVHFAAVTQVEHDVGPETALEWVQDPGRLFWDREEIKRRQADKLGDAFDRVWKLAAEQEVTLRDAALAADVNEVGAALEARGLFP